MHGKKTLNKIIISLSSCLMVSFCSGFLYAQQMDFDGANNVSTHQSLGHIQLASSSSSSIVTSGPFQMTVNIDTAICDTWPSQCSNTGHTPLAALSTNSNPIRVNVQVLTTSGVPVKNLGSNNFSFSCPFMPPGQFALKRLDCSDCFIAGTDGMYAFFINPDPSFGSSPWHRGNYVMQVQVTVGKKIVRALSPFEIP